jgi:hypothetical protein
MFRPTGGIEKKERKKRKIETEGKKSDFKIPRKNNMS